MKEHDINPLHSKFSEFMNSFPYEYILGITVDIQEFLSHRKGIKSFDIFFDHEKNRYSIIIKIKDFNCAKAREIFFGLLNFVAYPGGSIYFVKTSGSSILYEIASFDEKEVGYYCRIEFLPDK